MLREMVRMIPNADYLYFGDTARLPYGSKSAETVSRYAVGAAHFLEQHGAELLVIACNTASALALDSIRAGAHVPVIGVVEPGADRGAQSSKGKKVVVVATDATVSSHAYLKALEARGISAKEKACPLLVPLVEEGWIDHKVTEEVARIYLDEAFRDGFQGADVLLLGCTHYPLLRPMIAEVAGDRIAIVDSATATASSLAELLGINGLEAPGGEAVHVQLTTGDPDRFRSIAVRMFGDAFPDVESVELGAAVR